MTTFLLVLMALLLIGALERNHRRQPPHPPGPYGAHVRDDRDWARTRLELLSLDDQAELGHRPPPRSSRHLNHVPGVRKPSPTTQVRESQQRTASGSQAVQHAVQHAAHGR